ncbi:hypothetical protein LSTR_LSTR005987 [Laodelphax striatellus]|uniref:F-box domain-containing protein n=1 Tax=Laodelphax striatellus TaxID=195883 RepID=A0A482XP58_LAOST|nr:hypothetical protein LSTR_LSTR005987 [Laodelphax striatellus]
MTDKSDVEIEISDSVDKDDSNRDNDPTPSVSDSVEAKIDLGEPQSCGANTVKPNAASGDTALPETIVSESMDFVAIFPPELTHKIFSFLPTNELECFGSVSQVWSEMANELIQSRYLLQRTILKNNWEKCDYSELHLQISEQDWYDPDRNVVLLPSNVPHYLDFHRPLLKCQGLNVLQINDNLTLAGEIVHLSSSIRKVCLMGYCLVWMRPDGSVYSYDGKQATGFRVKAVSAPGTWLYGFIDDKDVLTMDSHHIVAMSREGFLRVWCKQTNELTLQREKELSTRQLCSLFDGYLIISSGQNTSSDSGKTSKIEIHNLRSGEQNRLLQTFFVDGTVINLNSNERYIFLNLESNHRLIQVRDKESYAIKYSHNYFEPCEMCDVNDDFVVLKVNFNPYKYKILTLASGKCITITSYSMQLYTLFDNIAIRRTRDGILRVMDWKQNIELYDLRRTWKKTFVVDVNESMVVTMIKNSHWFKIYKFG